MKLLATILLLGGMLGCAKKPIGTQGGMPIFQEATSPSASQIQTGGVLLVSCRKATAIGFSGCEIAKGHTLDEVMTALKPDLDCSFKGK